MPRLYILTLSVIALGNPGHAEPVIWDDSPIPVRLTIGQARQLQFPESLIDFEVRPHVKAGSRITRAQNGQTVTWTPKQAFDQETAVASTVSGRVYVLSVSTHEAAPTAPLRVLDPHLVERAAAAPEEADPPEATEPEALAAARQTGVLPSQPSYSYEELARYAAQHFAGPDRLIRPLPGVTSIPVPNRTVPLIRFAHIEARPIRAWTDGELHVTAVRLKNLSTLPVDLDPSQFFGQWLFIVPHIQTGYRLSRQQNTLTPLARLRPKGALADEGNCYLVSDQPFARAL